MSNPFLNISIDGDSTIYPGNLFCFFTVLTVRIFFWCKFNLQQYTMMSSSHVLSSLEMSCICLKTLSLEKGILPVFSHKLLLLSTQHYLCLVMAQSYLFTKVFFFYPWVRVCRTICFQNQITALNELLVSSRPSTSWQHSLVISAMWLVTAGSYSGLSKSRKYSEV